MTAVDRKQERKVTKFFQRHANNIIGIVFQGLVFLTFFVVVQHKQFLNYTSENKRLTEELISMKALVENDPAPSWLKQVIEASGDSDIEFKMSYINPAYEDTYQITNEYYKNKTDFDIWDSRVATNFYMNDLVTYTANKNGCYEERIPRIVGSSSIKKRIVCKWIVNKSNGVSYVAGRVIEFNKTTEID